MGEPDRGYPERWAITRWIDGSPPPAPAPAGPASDWLARDLAAFASALHDVPTPGEAADDPNLRGYRAGSLRGIDARIRRCLDECRRVPGASLDIDACLDVWAEAVALPDGKAAGRWVHADLLAENLLVRDGRLAAVLDFGGLAIGDPSVDLVVAWDALGPTSREAFRASLDVDDATWLRGRGWALAIAAMTLPYYWRSMPTRCAGRLAMAQQVLDDAAGRRAPGL